jgi:hypothetical protein
MAAMDSMLDNSDVLQMASTVMCCWCPTFSARAAADAKRHRGACRPLADQRGWPLQQPVTAGGGSTAAGIQQEGQAVGTR